MCWCPAQSICLDAHIGEEWFMIENITGDPPSVAPFTYFGTPKGCEAEPQHTAAFFRVSLISLQSGEFVRRGCAEQVISQSPMMRWKLVLNPLKSDAKCPPPRRAVRDF